MRLFVSKRSIKRVSIATTRASISSRGERDRSRRSLWQPTRQDRRRTRMPSHGRHRKTWPAVDPDACRFLRPCSEAPRDLHGQVVRSTPVDAGPTNARPHPKTLQARRRIRVQRKTSSFSWSKRGSLQRVKQILNLFVSRGFLTMGPSASPIVLVVVVVLVVGWGSKVVAKGWTDGRRKESKRRNQREEYKRREFRVCHHGRGGRTTTIGATS